MRESKPTYEELEKRVRQLDEDANQESEGHFRALFEKAPLGYQSLDINGCFITVNQAWQDLLGYEREEVIGKWFGDFLSPRKMETFKKNFPRFKKLGEISRVEFELAKKNGSFVLVSLDGRIGYDNQGNFKQTHCVIQDITEQKRIEADLRAHQENLEQLVEQRTEELLEANAALRVSEEKYRLLVENQAGLIVKKGVDGKLLFASQSFCRLFDKTEEELLQGGFVPEIHEDDRAGAETATARRLDASPAVQFEQRTMTPNGWRWLSWVDTAIRNNKGEIVEILGMGRDIHDQKTAVDERDRILNMSYDLICVAGTDGYFKYLNPAWEKTLGHTTDELLAKPYLDVIHPDDHEINDAEVSHLADGNDTIDFENRYLHKDGSVVTISWRAVPYVEEQLMFCVGRDITKQKDAEASLRASERRLAKAQEIAQVGSFEFDAAMTEGIWSDQTYKLFGLEPGEVAPSVETALECVHPEDKDYVAASIAAFRESPKPQSIEFRVLRDDGRTRVLCSSMEGSVLGDQSGAVYVTGTVQDITERKRVEGERNRVFDLPNALIMVATAEGTIVRVSAGWRNSLGYTVDEMVGRSIHDFIHPEDIPSTRRESGDIADRKGSENFENRYCHKNGSYRTLSWSASADPLTNLLFGVALDITERKQLDEERSKASKLESIGVLAGGIAHDFNNYLTAIVGNISLARMMVDQQGGEGGGLLLEAEKAGMRATDLTQQLLTFSKGGEPVIQPFCIKRMLRDVSHLALRGSNVKMELRLPDEPCSVEADEGQINQVLYNLVINADQAMPKGGMITIRADNVMIDSGDFLPLPKGLYVKIAVEDRGAGIPADHLSRIFDPYFTTKQKGSGLGLATCYSIAKRHRGLIGVESKDGAGATFTIYLPASTDHVQAKPTEREDRSAIQRRVLIMDDEKMVRAIASRMLKHIGCEVEGVADGTEAIRSFKKARATGMPFDAVILDLTIPGGMGGKEAVKRLKRIDSDIEVIVSSGFSNDPVMSDYRENGFDAIVSKPYGIDDMKRALRGVLRAKAANFS